MPPTANLDPQELALKRMLKLTNSLLGRADSQPFAEPVDWRGLELWDYPKIVKKMMDLGTVKRKLERKMYKTHQECAEDLRLIWYNCQLYNEEGSDFWHLANVFKKKFEDRYKKIQAEFGDSIEDVVPTSNSAASKASSTGPSSQAKAISMDRKSRFSEKIFRLNGTELGHLIQTLELKCPEALEDVCDSRSESPQVEINVDAIPTSTFLELESYLLQKVPNKKRKI